ncbi:paREP2a [Pyrobaculum aerophilum str. IM2]|uniref:PaREP2a n=1 Tax=Pyrobaculum aerophilum (strain ATCC 51768 / DSM 7523 / JCM 9630 / CIP 104966 / NBRC 100827 / IM2) TaxID=178306 RepID=Q8ZU03_PYRAE|nr:paREP2a [Pyrobaculum aerophilum str. IM2]
MRKSGATRGLPRKFGMSWGCFSQFEGGFAAETPGRGSTLY